MYQLIYNLHNMSQIIIEQCIEWSTCLYTVFIDFEKEFNSINREAMWKEMKCYGVPTQIVNLITETYRGYACRVVHEGQVSEPISVQTECGKVASYYPLCS
jgi:hypothetical protein